MGHCEGTGPRVINVLHHWLANNLDEFLDNPQMLIMFREFLTRKRPSDMPGRQQLLQRAFTIEVCVCVCVIVVSLLRKAHTQSTVVRRWTGVKQWRSRSHPRRPHRFCPSNAARWATWKPCCATRRTEHGCSWTLLCVLHGPVGCMGTVG
jgi:hypothetical protein